MIGYLNIFVCIVVMAVMMVALVQVAASPRAFDGVWQRWFAFVSLVVWIIHSAVSAFAIGDGTLVATPWIITKWIATALLGIVLIKVFAKFERIKSDLPNKRSILARNNYTSQTGAVS